EGRFLLTAPEAGVWTVVVRAEDYVPMRYFPLPLVRSIELPPVALLRDEPVRIELEGGGPVAAGVWVMATSAGGDYWRPRTAHGWRPAARFGRVDEAGGIRLARAPGEPLDVHVLTRKHLPRTRSAAEPSATVKLPAAGSPAAGTPAADQWLIEVVDPGGEPLAGVVVASAELGWPLGKTREDGRLSFGGVTSQPVSLVLLAADGNSSTVELRPSSGDDGRAVRFPLPPAQLAIGRVLDQRSRRPLAGALVWPGHDPGNFALTDAEGRYEFPAPPDKRFWLQAEAAGFLPRIGGINAGEIELVAASDFGGEVTDADGRPLSGVRLSARILPPGKHPRALRFDVAVSRSLSDRQGRFRLDGLLADGSYQLAAAKRGFVTARIRAEVEPPEEQRQPLRIVLERVRVAAGRVVDVEQQPIADAAVQVTASGEAEGGPERPARTDATGRFEVLERLPPSVDLEARKQGFASLTVRGVEIPPGDGPIDLGTLVLVAGATLRGLVEDPEGAPIARASVWLSEDAGPSQPGLDLLRLGEPVAETDARGRFRIEDLPPRQKIDLEVGREGYLSATILGVELPHPDPIQVTLEPGSSIRGRVVDENDEPIAGARVTVRAQDPPAGTVAVRHEAKESKSTRTDAGGEFLIAGVVAGKVAVEASASGFQPSSALAVELPEGGTVDDLELVLAHAAVIEGRVTNFRDEPVAEARVLLARSSARSDAEGWYRLDQAPPGVQTIEVRHTGYQRLLRELEVEPGANVADFVLAGGLRVAGHVVEESGGPVADAYVGLRLRGLAESREYRTGTDAEGRFEFAAVISGRYDLDAEKAGYGAVALEDRVAVLDASVEGVLVELPSSVSVTGRLVGLSFEELSVVRIAAESGQRTLAGTADYEGRYRIADLGPGDWLLKAWLRGGSRQAQARLLIEPGVRQLERDLEFGGGLTLTGTVLYGGAPLAGTRVTATGFAATVERSVVTGQEGGFRLEDLKAGTYRLALDNARELIVHYQDVELSGDRHLEIEISTARLRGRVTSATTGEPVAGAQVTLQRLLGPDGTQPGPVVGLVASSEGTFAVERAAAGRQRLTVRKAGYAPGEKALELRSGEELSVELTLSPTAGLDLVVHLASGARPPFAAVVVHGPSGQLLVSESSRVFDDGHARFSTVPPGTWEVLVTAPGGAVTRTLATVPGEPLQVVLPDAGRLRVRVPLLHETDRRAILTVSDQTGQAFLGLDDAGALRQQWDVINGLATVASIPAGVWRLQVVDASGQRWEGTALTSGAQEAEVRLE
ncbi:MAG: carboxypeptidase regulatory-like domain-containing protein, partial [Thermoanaerobaculia bacterium]